MKQTKTEIIKCLTNLFEHEEKIYYKPGRVGNFWSNSYIKYQSISDRNKTLSNILIKSDHT